jgi:DNA end-binding protein Ku
MVDKDADWIHAFGAGGFAMPRPIWKGSISFGLVNIPITLFPAESQSDLHFQMIDSRNHARVRYKRVNEVTEEEVPWSEIVKGYEFEDGNYILLSDEDFKQADREATKTIEIEDFVDLGAIDYAYFDKPYYLVPGKGGEKGYVLLREALRRKGKVGIARVVIRTKEYLAALIPEGDALVLDLLRYHQQLRDLGEYAIPHGDLEAFKVTRKELDLAETLVESMAAEWEPEKYHDEYHDALMAWIEKKAREGKTEALPEEKAEAEAEGGKVIDMMALLKKSLEAKGEGARKKKAEEKGEAPRRKGSGKPTGTSRKESGEKRKTGEK